MKRILAIAVATCLLFQPAAFAQVDPGTRFPSTLIDSNCENDDDGGGTAFVDGMSTRTTQTTGSADALCDHDNRIGTGAFTADRVMGPILSGGARAVMIDANASAVTGGTTTWAVCIATMPKYEPPAGVPASTALRIMGCAPMTGATSGDFLIHCGSAGTTLAFTGAAGVGSCGTFNIPDEFYILLDVAGGGGHSTPTTATSWTGSLGLRYAY